MPIYAYRCDACGHEAEVLRKVSDAPLTTCPSCGEETFNKLLTAAGFQLKGSGWYATDFKGGASSAAAASTPSADAPSEPSAHACGTGGCGACA
jgi:putative FmdB family regulatory protein